MRMTNFQPLLKRLELYIDQAKSESKYFRDDVVNISEQIFSALKEVVNVNALESRCVLEQAINFSDLKWCADLFINRNLTKLKRKLSSTIELDPQKEHRDLTDLVNTTLSIQNQISVNEALLRIELSASKALNNLLAVTDSNDEILIQIENKITEKLNGIGPNDLRNLWAKVRAEITSDMNQDKNNAKFIAYPDLIDGQFFDKPFDSETKRRIANYVTRLKPQIIVRMLSEGYTSYPLTILSAARMLTISNVSSLNPLNSVEIGIINKIGRIVGALKASVDEDISKISSILGLEDSARIISGPVTHEIYQAINRKEIKNSFEFVLREFIDLILLLESNVPNMEEVVQLLVQYKLGLEVQAPGKFEDLSKFNESLLQRHMCKFLVEKGVWAVGTKFGRNETDLVTEGLSSSLPNGVVIEAKIFNTSSKITSSSIHVNLAQLESYLDGSKFNNRGVLAIYNFSDSVISVPNKKWIRGRYWILPINLCKPSPSDRSGLALIEESKGSEIIDVIHVEKKLRKKGKKKVKKVKKQNHKK